MAKTKTKQDRTQIVDLVTNTLLPLVEAKGAILWDVDFRREGGNSFLSIEVDKAEGVDILLCESLSREIEAFLDKVDPIEEAYYLEVGSAGLERALKKPAHFAALAGRLITVKFFAPHKVYGKEFTALLQGLAEDMVQLEKGDEIISLPLKDLASVKLTYVPIPENAPNPKK